MEQKHVFRVFTTVRQKPVYAAKLKIMETRDIILSKGKGLIRLLSTLSDCDFLFVHTEEGFSRRMPFNDLNIKR